MKNTKEVIGTFKSGRKVINIYAGDKVKTVANGQFYFYNSENPEGLKISKPARENFFQAVQTDKFWDKMNDVVYMVATCSNDVVADYKEISKGEKLTAVQNYFENFAIEKGFDVSLSNIWFDLQRYYYGTPRLSEVVNDFFFLVSNINISDKFSEIFDDLDLFACYQAVQIELNKEEEEETPAVEVATEKEVKTIDNSDLKSENPMYLTQENLGIFSDLCLENQTQIVKIGDQIANIMYNIDKKDCENITPESKFGNIEGIVGMPNAFPTVSFTQSDMFAFFDKIGKYYYLRYLVQLHVNLSAIFMPYHLHSWEALPEHIYIRNEAEYMKLIREFIDDMLSALKKPVNKEEHILTSYMREEEKKAICLFIGFLESQNILVKMGYKKNLLANESK